VTRITRELEPFSELFVSECHYQLVKMSGSACGDMPGCLSFGL